MKTLLLIDAHAMIHRAYHALPLELASKDGIPTNAIYGFFLMIQKVLSSFKPTHLAVCFDTPKPTFRKELFKEYQAKRPEMEDTLKTQIPLIKVLLSTGGIRCLEKPGFEADDVIGTMAEKNKQNFDRVLILTGDRDILQLADDNVFVITPKKGVTDFNLYTPREVENKFGVTPEHIPDYKALAGDASDNYNTARGIGPKTAVKLLSRYDTIEKLLNNVDSVENEKWKHILKEYKDSILLFKKIATIVRDVDVVVNEQDLAFNGFKPEMEHELRKLSLYSLVEKLFNNKNKKTDAVAQKKIQKEKNDNGQIDLFS